MTENLSIDSAWEALQEQIGHRFVRLELLREAMSHRSYANERSAESIADNERLEFLGDAVLDLAIGRLLFERYPEFSEGDLTRIRSEVVAEPALAGLARQLQLGDSLLLGRGEVRTGGRNKASLLANALEALLGAVFLDADFDTVALVVNRLFMPMVETACSWSGQDYKTRLQELLQARQESLPEYQLVNVAGPAHQRSYTVEVLADGEVCGRGQGNSKKKAEQAAAREALAQFGKLH